MDAVDRCQGLISLNSYAKFSEIPKGGLQELVVENLELAVAVARYLPKSAADLTALNAQ